VIFPTGRVEPNKIFLSHASEDRVIAAKIKEELGKNGFNVFVAHDDIPGTEEWREKILSELKISEIFIALRTKNYSKKSFTEQECGLLWRWVKEFCRCALTVVLWTWVFALLFRDMVLGKTTI